MRLATTTIIALSAISQLGIAQDRGPAPRSPELEVLDQFVGIWDLVMTTTIAGREAATSKTVSHRSWSKGSQFVIFEDPGQTEITMLLTFDPQTKAYPGSIMIGPRIGLVIANWDEDKKTMNLVT